MWHKPVTMELLKRCVVMQTKTVNFETMHNYHYFPPSKNSLLATQNTGKNLEKSNGSQQRYIPILQHTRKQNWPSWVFCKHWDQYAWNLLWSLLAFLYMISNTQEAVSTPPQSTSQHAHKRRMPVQQNSTYPDVYPDCQLFRSA